MGTSEDKALKYFKTPTEFKEAIFILGNDLRRSIFIASFMSMDYKGYKVLHKTRDYADIEILTDLTISSLHKELLKIKKVDYKAVHKQARLLEKRGYIKLVKNGKEQGQPVYIHAVFDSKNMDFFKFCLDKIINPLFEYKS